MRSGWSSFSFRELTRAREALFSDTDKAFGQIAAPRDACVVQPKRG
jgi:hypothetical protein